jgi:hypothetical protein
MAGYNLFRGKANCNSCHLDGRSTAPTPATGTAPNGEDTGAAASTAPLFTCFGSANLGLPLNPRDAIYYQNIRTRRISSASPQIPLASASEIWD